MSGRLLVAYDNAANFVSTTDEYLDSISRYSRWDVRYLHVGGDAKIRFDLNEFDAIFQNYCARLPFDGYLSDDYIERLKSFRGVKLLSVQDEWERTDRLRAAIHELGYHLVLACVPQVTVERLYPRTLFPKTQFVPVVAGYVSEYLARRGEAAISLAERPIAIGYRGRDHGGRLGRLGFLKFEVGRRMREICEARGIPCDIEWSEEKRVYGEGWYDFLASCRAMLGSEGGSNVFDFDGSLEETYRKLSAERGGAVGYQEFRAHTDLFEGKYIGAQMTPRVFEAAALKTPLILVSGHYSGLLEPGEHYLELDEDFSNADAVLGRLSDLDGLAAMADRAYRRLIASGEYAYRRFVAMIDELLDKKAAELGVSLRPSSERQPKGMTGADPNALVSFEERPTETPRHFVFYEYKRAARELSRVRSQLARVYEYHAEDVARLSAERDRLNETYQGLPTVPVIRLYLWYRKKIAARSAALVTVLGNRTGRAAFADVVRHSAAAALLMQLARVVAAKRAAERSGAALGVKIADGILEICTAAAFSPTSANAPTAFPAEVTVALSAGRIASCILRANPEQAARRALLFETRYELPDLLRWLAMRPDRLLGLVFNRDVPPTKKDTRPELRAPAPTASVDGG
jgi:hypothetical protein